MDERSSPPLQTPPSSNAAPSASSAPRIPASVVEYRRSSSGAGSGLHFQYDTPVTARDAVREIARLREDGTRMLRDLTRSQAEGKRLQIELERAQNDRGVMLVELETARKKNISLADQARGAIQAAQRAEKELQEVRRALHGERARAASAVAAVGRLTQQRDELQSELARRSNRPPQVKTEQMDIELAPPTDKLSSLPPRRPSSVATPPSPSISIASSAHPTSPRPMRLPSFPSQKHDRPSLASNSTTSSPSETSSRYLPPASAMAPSSSSDARPAASSSSSPPGTRSFSLPSLSLPLPSGSPLRPTLTSTNSTGSSPPGPSSAAPCPIVVSPTTPNVEASRSPPLPHLPESNHKRKRSHDAVDDAAAAGPTPSQLLAPTPVQPQKREPRLSISHLSLLYETRGNKMSCRFCGYSFRLTAAWVALMGHSQGAHADKCAELVALGPAQVLEKSHRLGTGTRKG